MGTSWMDAWAAACMHWVTAQLCLVLVALLQQVVERPDLNELRLASGAQQRGVSVEGESQHLEKEDAKSW